MSNLTMSSDNDQVKMDSKTFFNIFNQSTQISVHEEMPQHMLQVLDEDEKMFFMPLFKMSKQRYFNPQLEY